MIIKFNTNLIPLFSGTYNTDWEPRECDNELELDYNHADLMKSIISVYHENEKYILSELDTPFIKKIKILKSYYCPREYNFKTDQLDFNLTIDKKLMLKTLDGLADNADFNRFLRDNYTSYDGFMSFTPNNYRDLQAAIIDPANDEHNQAMAALIVYFVKNNLKSIKGDMLENWNSNGYGGLDYKIVKNEG